MYPHTKKQQKIWSGDKFHSKAQSLLKEGAVSRHIHVRYTGPDTS